MIYVTRATPEQILPVHFVAILPAARRKPD
jgi:hypothetical protein